MDDAPLGVGGVAAKGTLVGHLLGREVFRDGGRLVGDAGSGRPDGLPGLVGGGHVDMLWWVDSKTWIMVKRLWYYGLRGDWGGKRVGSYKTC